jgi:hypothetical protein
MLVFRLSRGCHSRQGRPSSVVTLWTIRVQRVDIYAVCSPALHRVVGAAKISSSPDLAEAVRQPTGPRNPWLNILYYT